MCGIAGVGWNAGAEPVREADLRRMTSVLVHRGPDDSGHYLSTDGLRAEAPQSDAIRASRVDYPASNGPGAALGHRRLSIIDLAGGQQPLANENHTVWIVFNGEIYNYRELRAQLESQGHRFRTSSDTEAIVHLYEQYGTDCVPRLRGMFSFAIWDDQRKRLFLARDRMGQKPLFYRHAGGRLFFASELKALLQIPDAPRELNLQAVDQYLTYQYVPHPHCILRGYNKLPPAHWGLFENGKLQIERYWRPNYDKQIPELDSPDDGLASTATWPVERWQQELRSALTESVRLRMRSDVPLGSFLSGGVDSTIITGIMQELSQRQVHSFSIGFPVKQFDESPFAREAAAHLNTQHHEWVIEPSALEMLPRLIWHYDEPFADSSAIPMMYLSQMTRQHVTVALSGDGGDELFAGYDRYQAVRLGAQYDRLPRVLRSVLGARMWQSIPASVQQKSKRRRLKRLVVALNDPPERRYLKWIGIFDDDRRRSLYNSGLRGELNGADPARFLLDAYRECPARDFVTQTTCADLLTYLPCDILTKVDIASMAYSLECRSPFLDHRVVELAARMPIELKLKGRTGKRILIDTFRHLLPASIQKRSKMGFGVPLDHWFRDELKPLLNETLLDARSLNRGYFDANAVRQLITEHQSRQWDHSYRLWALLCLELWQQTFLDPTNLPLESPKY